MDATTLQSSSLAKGRPSARCAAYIAQFSMFRASLQVSSATATCPCHFRTLPGFRNRCRASLTFLKYSSASVQKLITPDELRLSGLTNNDRQHGKTSFMYSTQGLSSLTSSWITRNVHTLSNRSAKEHIDSVDTSPWKLRTRKPVRVRLNVLRMIDITGFPNSRPTDALSQPNDLSQQQKLVQKAVEQTMAQSPPASDTSNYKEIIQVITDIDDTVKCSGGLRLAGIPLGGIDTRYARGEFYPGVFQFALELATNTLVSVHVPPPTRTRSRNWLRRSIEKVLVHDLAISNMAQQEEKRAPLPVAVLTARAKEFKFALKIKRHGVLGAMFHDAGQRAGYKDWGIGPVLYGSVAEWVFQWRKGQKKFENFEKLVHAQKRIFENQNVGVKYIYIGDTGEMDAEAGYLMAQAYPDIMKAVFLHVVSEQDETDLSYQDRVLNGIPVLYFRTYAGAARKAYEQGLLSVDGLIRVMESAQKDAIAQARAVALRESVELSATYGGTMTIYKKGVSLSTVKQRLYELENDISVGVETVRKAGRLDKLIDFQIVQAHTILSQAEELFSKSLAKIDNSKDVVSSVKPW
eukprot:CAMPEP_0184698356 /NCGR_PEP_ID=MMETSP0313-20130426/5008_1 /TAXON_ID=2792 /ORGANISM="Porphyridium aerugineum, Strain SAG 1380-2" /LENGTH=576 /DNA_ID=CAMNT_0027157285 /DNA_START=204 /DNA_END=1931 /DNA_ORIENTATION=-